MPFIKKIDRGIGSIGLWLNGLGLDVLKYALIGRFCLLNPHKYIID